MLDRPQGHPGRGTWASSIVQAIDQSHIMLFILTQNANQSN